MNRLLMERKWQKLNDHRHSREGGNLTKYKEFEINEIPNQVGNDGKRFN